MPTVRRLLVASLIVMMTAGSPVFAGQQQHVIDSSELAAALDQHVAKEGADRAAIREALMRPEVRDVAANIGLDLAKASAAVETMTGSDLTRAADAARQVNERFVGGASTVVISTTTIIIILLLLILLIVILKA
jgi:hypothetical protein